MDFSALAAFDTAVASALRFVQSPAVTRVMWVATVSGETAVMVIWTALAAVMLWSWGKRRSATVLAGLMLLDPLLVDLLKGLFARPRPPASGMLIALPSGLSLPSGHAVATMVFYGLLAVTAVRGQGPAWRKTLAAAGALVAAGLVGVSRVYLGVHFASDVVAGWAVAAVLVGAGWGALALWDRIGGPEAASDASAQRSGRLAALAVTCAFVAAEVLFVQAGLEPLL